MALERLRGALPGDHLGEVGHSVHRAGHRPGFQAPEAADQARPPEGGEGQAIFSYCRGLCEGLVEADVFTVLSLLMVVSIMLCGSFLVGLCGSSVVLPLGASAFGLT